MQKIFFLLLGLFIPLLSVAARIGIGDAPDNALMNNTSWELIDILSFVEELLLKVALPLVIVGSSLYIAYELFLAQGNEEKLKQAWKSITYSFVGVIAIALGYAVISLVSRLAF